MNVSFAISPRALPALLLPLLAAGCIALGPDPSAPDPSPAFPSAWQPSPEADAFAQSAFALPPPSAPWWSLFDDPLLADLLERVASSNFSLASALSSLDASAAALRMARADFAPSLDASASPAYDRATERVRSSASYPDNPAWLYSGGFSLAWEIDLWGRVRRSVQAAAADLDASQADLDALRLSLRSRAASLYIRLRTLQRQLACASENARIQDDSLALTRARFDAGLSGELDVAQAEMLLASTRASIPPLQAEISSVIASLAALSARPAADLAPLRVPAPIPALSAMPDALPAALLRSRPDVRAAEARLAAASARIGVAKAELLPRLDINGSFALASTDASELFSSHASQFSLGPAFSWPVFRAGRLRANVRAKTALAEAALAAYRQTLLDAAAECEAALASYRASVLALPSLADAADAAARSLDLARALYRNGLTDFQNVLDMQRQLSASQDALAQMSGAVSMNLVALFAACGDSAPAPNTNQEPLP